MIEADFTLSQRQPITATFELNATVSTVVTGSDGITVEYIGSGVYNVSGINLKNAIIEEAEIRTSADNTLGQRIDNEIEAREIADEQLQNNIDTLSEDLSQAIEDEAEAREQADTTLGNRITQEATSRENADTALGSRIDDETTARENADEELAQAIREEADRAGTAESNLQTAIDAEESERISSDNALQDQIDTKQPTISDLAEIRSNAQAGKNASDTIETYGNIVTHNINEFATAAQGAKADTALQAGDNISSLINDLDYTTASDVSGAITAHNISNVSHQDIRTELSGKQATISDLDDIRAGSELGSTSLQPADIIDNTSSTSANKALSANMGKSLQDQINNIERRTKYLTDWNCATGQPTTNPPVSPYQYTTGDFYIVSTVASEGGTNYKPTGTSYVIGQPASTVVETEEVSQNDLYIFDGTQWNLRKISPTVETSFATISGNPYDNTNLAAALNDKQDELSSAQLAATNSGITLTKVTNYDNHLANTTIHVTASDKVAWSQKQNAITASNKLSSDLVDDSDKTNKFVTTTEKTLWNGKQAALDTTQMAAVNSGITSTKVSDYDTHLGNTTIHVTASDKIAWSQKQNEITSSNKLASDLVDDTNQTNLFVTAAEKSDWNGKADDDDVVHLTGTETITGLKTFQTTGVASSLVLNNTTNSSAIEFRKMGVTQGYFGVAASKAPFYATNITGTWSNIVRSTLNAATGTSTQPVYIDSSGVAQTCIDLNTKQNATDNTLTTTDKTIVGAINELDARPSMPELDEVTITTNTDDELQTIAVIDQNNTTNGIKTWTGTKAEYDAITTKDNNTIYNITDDSDITLPLLQTLYPVGSLYLTTNSTCPLASLFGTWKLVSQDRVLQGAGSRGTVGTTINESLPNIKGAVDGAGVTGESYSSHLTGSGAFYDAQSNNCYKAPTEGSSANVVVNFDASRSSSTYQDNAPVQQNAYLINVYRRTA